MQFAFITLLALFGAAIANPVDARDAAPALEARQCSASGTLFCGTVAKGCADLPAHNCCSGETEGKGAAKGAGSCCLACV